MDNCIFCEKPLKSICHSEGLINCDCPVCGYYMITREAHMDFPKSEFKKDSIKISVYLRRKNIVGDNVIIFYDCNEAIKNKAGICFEDIIKKFPYTLSERLDWVLLNLAKLTRYLGEYISITENDYPIFYPDNWEANACFFIMEQLYHQGLIENDNKSNKPVFPSRIRLTAHGWERIVELQRGTSAPSNNVFIAMWFDSSMTDAFKHGIEKAIIDTGYAPIRVDFEEHNEKICDRIIADIRKCRFVVCDFTGHRGGVYFEAGFAMGLGKTVIWSCREEDIENCHFDTRQYNHIVWKNEKDLYEKLKKRIEATIY